jgi:hypothetical protein
VNRWGKAVFSSTDRLFRWDGEEYPPGQYYYLIQYAHRSYKGTVSFTSIKPHKKSDPLDRFFYF